METNRTDLEFLKIGSPLNICIDGIVHSTRAVIWLSTKLGQEMCQTTYEIQRKIITKTLTLTL